MPGMELKKPLALEELKRARKPIRNVNIEHKRRLKQARAFCRLDYGRHRHDGLPFSYFGGHYIKKLEPISNKTPNFARSACVDALYRIVRPDCVLA